MNIRWKVAAAMLALMPGLAQPAQSAASPPAATEQMKVRIKVGTKELTATLEDNAAAKDFAALLPLSLTLRDYTQTEKIADLPKRLSTAGAPAGIDPAIGDITYYAPWGNLAIFYQDFGYSTGLIKLGRLESGIEEFRRSGALQVTIERVNDS